jgi:PHD/YefM family antitoxin component YafN of YafNO toxin-antitoxin module
LGKPTTPMISRMPITKARVNLGAVVKRTHLKGEYFILEKDGIPVAGIMPADELEDYLEILNPKAQAAIKKSSEDLKAGRVRPAEILLAEIQKRREKREAKSSKPQRG